MNDKTFVSFYIDCDEKTRKERMESRLDNKKDIEKRIINDRKVFKDELKNKVDYVINSENSSIKELATKIYKLYKDKVSKTH